MKGLIRNNFYLMESNMGISFLIAAFLAATPLLLPDSNFIPRIISIQIFIFIVNTGTSLHADTVAKWNKYELTLPVGRKEAILAKYISIAILILLGVLMGGITLIVSSAAGISLESSAVLSGYTYGLTLSAISVGIMYPLMLKFGTDKNELIMILSAFAAVGIMLLAAFALSPWTEGMNMHHPFVALIYTLSALVIFIASYFISVGIYQRKEFA